LYTTPLSSLIHSHKLDHHLYADDTQVYISLSTADTDLSLKQLSDCLSDISGWMANNKLRLNANKTDFIIIDTLRQRGKLTNFFPTNILSHSITPSDTVRNLGGTFDSDRAFPFCPSSEISSLVPCSISHNFQTLHYLHIYFPCFLYHPTPENSIHLVFTCCLFPGLKLILRLLFFQLLSLLFGIHSLNIISNQIA